MTIIIKDIELDGTKASIMASKMILWFGQEKAKKEAQYFIDRDSKSDDPYWKGTVPFWENVLEHLNK